MHKFLAALAAITLMSTGSALAQEGAAAPELSLGAPVEESEGEIYSAGDHGAWSLRCMRQADQNDPCHLYQLLEDDEGNSVAEFSLFALEDKLPAIIGAVVATPLDTLLTEQVRVSVDDGGTKRYPFTYCTPQSCIARIGLTKEDVDAFELGQAATVTIVPLASPSEKVELTLSLAGFTAGHQVLQAQHALQ